MEEPPESPATPAEGVVQAERLEVVEVRRVSIGSPACVYLLCILRLASPRLVCDFYRYRSFVFPCPVSAAPPQTRSLLFGLPTSAARTKPPLALHANVLYCTILRLIAESPSSEIPLFRWLLETSRPHPDLPAPKVFPPPFYQQHTNQLPH